MARVDIRVIDDRGHVARTLTAAAAPFHEAERLAESLQAMARDVFGGELHEITPTSLVLHPAMEDAP